MNTLTGIPEIVATIPIQPTVTLIAQYFSVYLREYVNNV